MFVGLSKIKKQKLNNKYHLFMFHLREGWTPAYARGLAKISQNDDSLMKLLFSDYREILDKRHKEIVGHKGWTYYG